jgi:hypothetical protein
MAEAKTRSDKNYDVSQSLGRHRGEMYSTLPWPTLDTLEESAARDAIKFFAENKSQNSP